MSARFVRFTEREREYLGSRVEGGGTRGLPMDTLEKLLLAYDAACVLEVALRDLLAFTERDSLLDQATNPHLAVEAQRVRARAEEALALTPSCDPGCEECCCSSCSDDEEEDEGEPDTLRSVGMSERDFFDYVAFNRSQRG